MMSSKRAIDLTQAENGNYFPARGKLTRWYGFLLRRSL